ncbi:MAG TPA: surface-adhesin E family protein [Steroidobacteraceae bacterium]|jgi:hypothetical protein|nr:surface-adhesin E family protein [Steroidobacteraceae bacterium]
MNSRNPLSMIAIALALAGPGALAQETGAADKWQSVAKTDNQEAFVNGSSIATMGAQLEARVKQNFALPQPSAKKGKTYLSSRTTYRFDCAQRRMAMKEVRTYAGSDLQGDPVQKATSSDKNLQWLDAPDSTVFGELLDYVCGRSPGG